MDKLRQLFEPTVRFFCGVVKVGLIYLVFGLITRFEYLTDSIVEIQRQIHMTEAYKRWRATLTKTNFCIYWRTWFERLVLDNLAFKRNWIKLTVENRYVYNLTCRWTKNSDKFKNHFRNAGITSEPSFWKTLFWPLE